MNKPQLPVQQYVPEQTIQHYLDALLQDAADELARADAEVAAPAPAPVVTEPPRPAVVHKLERPVDIIEPEVPAEPVIEPPAAPPLVQQAVAAWREEPFEALSQSMGPHPLEEPSEAPYLTTEGAPQGASRGGPRRAAARWGRAG